MTEFAIVSPLLLLMLLGVLEIGLLMGSIGTAHFAATDAARAVAEAGNDPSADQDGVVAVQRTLLVQFATINEIDISKVDASGNVLVGPNRYDRSGNILNPGGTLPWPPPNRDVHAAGGDIARVSISYTYHWKSGIYKSFLADQQLTASYDLRLEPQVF